MTFIFNIIQCDHVLPLSEESNQPLPQVPRDMDDHVLHDDARMKIVYLNNGGINILTPKPRPPSEQPINALDRSESRSDALVSQSLTPAVISSSGGRSTEISTTLAPYTRHLNPTHNRTISETGLLSDHLLRDLGDESPRHLGREHREKRTVWICVDISESKTALEGCKSCETRKHYNAKYNAVDHLRRRHLKDAGRGSLKVPNGSMEELQKWLTTEEVSIKNQHTLSDRSISPNMEGLVLSKSC